MPSRHHITSGTKNPREERGPVVANPDDSSLSSDTDSSGELSLNGIGCYDVELSMDSQGNRAPTVDGDKGNPHDRKNENRIECPRETQHPTIIEPMSIDKTFEIVILGIPLDRTFQLRDTMKQVMIGYNFKKMIKYVADVKIIAYSTDRHPLDPCVAVVFRFKRWQDIIRPRMLHFGKIPYKSVFGDDADKYGSIYASEDLPSNDEYERLNVRRMLVVHTDTDIDNPVEISTRPEVEISGVPFNVAINPLNAAERILFALNLAYLCKNIATCRIVPTTIKSPYAPGSRVSIAILLRELEMQRKLMRFACLTERLEISNIFGESYGSGYLEFKERLFPHQENPYPERVLQSRLANSDRPYEVILSGIPQELACDAYGTTLRILKKLGVKDTLKSLKNCYFFPVSYRRCFRSRVSLAINFCSYLDRDRVISRVREIGAVKLPLAFNRKVPPGSIYLNEIFSSDIEYEEHDMEAICCEVDNDPEFFIRFPTRDPNYEVMFTGIPENFSRSKEIASRILEALEIEDLSCMVLFSYVHEYHTREGTIGHSVVIRFSATWAQESVTVRMIAVRNIDAVLIFGSSVDDQMISLSEVTSWDSTNPDMFSRQERSWAERHRLNYQFPDGDRRFQLGLMGIPQYYTNDARRTAELILQTLGMEELVYMLVSVTTIPNHTIDPDPVNPLDAIYMHFSTPWAPERVEARMRTLGCLGLDTVFGRQAGRGNITLIEPRQNEG